MALQISTLVDELALLPEQSSATMRLLAMLDDPDTGAREIVPVLEADPSMTARLLTLANSAFFGLRAHASNVWSASMIVGLNVVRALAVSGGLGLSDTRRGAMPSGYWAHAVATGAAASVLAREVGDRPSDAFSAGLLHDLGVALMFRADRFRFGEAAVVIDGHAALDPDAEHEVFGTRHDLVAGVVLEHLYFPDALVAAVARHNEDPGDLSEQLGRIVVAAASLAEHLGRPSCSRPAPRPEVALAALGLSPEPPEELIVQVTNEIDALDALLR